MTKLLYIYSIFQYGKQVDAVIVNYFRTSMGCNSGF